MNTYSFSSKKQKNLMVLFGVFFPSTRPRVIPGHPPVRNRRHHTSISDKRHPPPPGGGLGPVPPALPRHAPRQEPHGRRQWDGSPWSPARRGERGGDVLSRRRLVSTRTLLGVLPCHVSWFSASIWFSPCIPRGRRRLPPSPTTECLRSILPAESNQKIIERPDLPRWRMLRRLPLSLAAAAIPRAAMELRACRIRASTGPAKAWATSSGWSSPCTTARTCCASSRPRRSSTRASSTRPGSSNSSGACSPMSSRHRVPSPPLLPPRR